jgi:lactate dehydrogenase-like 2-hydroxyacid dehydrogenase
MHPAGMSRVAQHTCCPAAAPCLQNKTVGIVGAGRIGAAYARMMVEGHKMNLVYYDPYPNKKLVCGHGVQHN